MQTFLRISINPTFTFQALAMCNTPVCTPENFGLQEIEITNHKVQYHGRTTHLTVWGFEINQAYKSEITIKYENKEPLNINRTGGWQDIPESKFSTEHRAGLGTSKIRGSVKCFNKGIWSERCESAFSLRYRCIRSLCIRITNKVLVYSF